MLESKELLEKVLQVEIQKDKESEEQYKLILDKIQNLDYSTAWNEGDEGFEFMFPFQFTGIIIKLLKLKGYRINYKNNKLIL